MTQRNDGSQPPLGGGFFRLKRPGESIGSPAHPNRQHLARIDHRCSDIFPGHELRVLVLSQDEFALRIDYEITPALPVQPGVSWSWSAEDDTGQAYEMAGGAHGPSRERDATTGVLSLTPLLAASARTLHVVLNPALLPSWEGRVCRFDVDVSRRGS